MADKEKDTTTVIIDYVENMIDRGDSLEQIKAFCSNKKGAKTFLKVTKKGRK